MLTFNATVYAKVVKPALQTLSASYTITIDSIHCIFNPHLPPGSDMNGLDFNDQFKVDLHHLASPTVVAATVTVTTHHSSHLVQVQGTGNFLSSTAPIWFASHFLMKHFETSANNKRFEIEHFQKEISNLAQTQETGRISSHCAECTKKFTAKAKPMKCSKCFKSYHTKHKCTVAKKPLSLFVCSKCTLSICTETLSSAPHPHTASPPHLTATASSSPLLSYTDSLSPLRPLHHLSKRPRSDVDTPDDF